MTKIKKTPMKQISLKLSQKQLEELRNHAKQTGENPISYHIRQAIHQYLHPKECEKNSL